MALPQDVIDAEVSLMQKCILNGKILKIDLGQKQGGCFQEINVILKGENGYYSLNSHIVIDDCTYDVIYEIFNKDFVKQIGKEVKFLVDKKNNTIISKENYDFVKYTNLEACKTNLQETKELQNTYYKLVLQDNKKEILNSNHTIYYSAILIIFLGIVSALLYKKFKKAKK